MANPTTNFGWVMPTATDLVTDLPADFNVFGQGVDTSMADLLGGTTGQILAKTSNTNMDFTWTTPNPGDITGVAVTSPITGGGTSGDVTIAIQDASTAQKGSVQLSDSTSTTSSVLAATPTAVKSAYDLANAAIAKSLVTTAGDIIYRNATVPARLPIGTASQVLQVNSGATAPEWVTVSAGAVTQIAQTVLTSTQTTISFPSISSSYNHLRVVWNGKGPGASTASLLLRFNADTAGNYDRQMITGNATALGLSEGFAQTTFNCGHCDAVNGGGGTIVIPNYRRTTLTKMMTSVFFSKYGTSTGNLWIGTWGGGWRSSAAITQLDFTTDSGDFQIGTIFTLYGEN